MASTFIEEYQGAQVYYDVRASKFYAEVSGQRREADSLASLRSLIRKQAEDIGEKEAKQTKQDAIHVMRSPAVDMWRPAETKDVILGAFGRVSGWRDSIRVWVTPKTRTGRYHEKERERVAVSRFRGEFYRDTPENRARLQGIRELVDAHNAQAQATQDRIQEMWEQMEAAKPTVSADDLPTWDR